MNATQKGIVVFLGFVLGSFIVLLCRFIMTNRMSDLVEISTNDGMAPEFDEAKYSSSLRNIVTSATVAAPLTTANPTNNPAPAPHPSAKPTSLPVKSLSLSEIPTIIPKTVMPAKLLVSIASVSSLPTAAKSIVYGEHNLFVALAVEAVKDPSNIALFSGKTTKKLLDQPITNVKAMLSLNGRVPTRTWSDVVRLVNKTFIQTPSHGAVHVHNEHKLGDFLEHMIIELKKQMSLRGSKLQRPPSKDALHKILDLGQAPIVLTNSADENWGFFSTGIGTRTTKWINMTNHLLIHGANYETVRYFLESDKVVLVVCNTHVDPEIGYHEKVISLPLGISRKGLIFSKALALSRAGVNKTTLLQINNSGWGDRAFINRVVSEAFNGSVRNTYKGANVDENKVRDVAKKRRERLLQRTQSPRRRRLSTHEQVEITDHYLETAQAKFVLCPSGLG